MKLYHQRLTKWVTRAARANWVYLGLIAGLAGGMAGCATGVKYSQLPKDADPSQELASLSEQFNRAKMDQVAVYAPDSFAKASDALATAQKGRAENNSNQDILDDVAKSRAYLMQAEARSKKAQDSLGEVVSARTHAFDAGAPLYATSKGGFAAANEKIDHFAREADTSNGPPSVTDKDRTEWMAQFQESELHAVEQHVLGRSDALIQKAKDEGAEKLAPQSLVSSQAKYSKAVAVIKHDPRDEAAIKTAAVEAEQSAERTMTLTRMAKGNENKHPEAIVAAALSEQEAAAELEKQKAGLEAQQGALEGRAKLTETVKMIQSKLSADEAQVFEDGKQVHIRLKALSFPSGSATIQPSGYALMGKVGNVIKETQPEKVRIDGRTDSVGSVKSNMALSAKRADAVKEFLVAGNAVDPTKVGTEAFGSSKPIASEKTKEGRALNRSIDVLLIPAGAGQSAGQAGADAPQE